ncbi:MAG: hypothetical protein Q7S39_11190 [Ignavibacteria bacterium]|nr:hypothetical protein [Ignavibacteria bacterium]
MKANLLITLFIVIVALCGGCEVNQPDEKSEFEPGYYILNGQGKTDLFRSNTLVAVIFENNVTPEQADSIVRMYGLVPIELFDTVSYGKDWDELIEEDVIVMKLPDDAKLDDYLTTFPRSSNQKFGDITEIKFCLPVFAFDNSGNPRSRFIINDELIISSKTDSLNTLGILEPYNVEFIRMGLGGEYIVRITHNSPANNLTISNMLYSHPEFNWVVPNAYANINRWP